MLKGFMLFVLCIPITFYAAAQDDDDLFRLSNPDDDRTESSRDIPDEIRESIEQSIEQGNMEVKARQFDPKHEIDSPTERLVSFVLNLHIVSRGRQSIPKEFDVLELSDREMETLKQIADETHLQFLDEERISRQAMCDEFIQSVNAGVASDEAASRAVADYESGAERQRRFEAVAQFIREQVISRMDAQTFRDLRREAELDDSTTHIMTSRSFFDREDREFISSICGGDYE